MNKIQYPYLRKRKLGKDKRIEVAADSMRVGKTTAVRVIAEGLRDLGYVVTDSYEDWQHNPYLKGSYADPEKNFLNSQKWFIRRKWEQVRDGAKEGVFLQDVAPEMDYCYAATNLRLGRMSSENFAKYDQYFRGLNWNTAPAPEVLVYLEVSDGELIRRAFASRREFESVDENYFLTMKRVNREWLAGATDEYKILTVETDKLDFAHEIQAKEKLIQLVIERLR